MKYLGYLNRKKGEDVFAWFTRTQAKAEELRKKLGGVVFCERTFVEAHFYKKEVK